VLVVVLGGCTSSRLQDGDAPRPPAGRTASPVPESGPTPVPTPTPVVPVPAGVPGSHLDEPLIRVLLDRTQSGVQLDQPGRAYRVRWQDDETWLWGPLILLPRSERSWQVAAFRDPDTARETEQRLRAALGSAVLTSSVPADNGFVRVRVRWLGDPPADAKQILSRAGFPDAYQVVGEPSIVVESAHSAPATFAAELTVEPQDGWPTAVDGRRYHGRLRFRIVGADLLVVNELNLESYLKGVVPAEMGPAQFPQLDALKAQTVAARTYTVAHLGDHDDEGYDICDTPACQVYKGADVQHRLTDRAVEETAGLIAVFDGEPIDAMYTSTCGGHTEDASLLFSGRAQPYLVPVECAWDRPMVVEGIGGGRTFQDVTAFRTHLAARALKVAEDATPAKVVAAVAAECGGPPPTDRREWSVAGYSRALTEAAGLSEATELVHETGAGALAELADLFNIPLGRPVTDDVRAAGWHLRAGLAALELQGIVTRDSGEAVPRPGGVGIFPRRASHGETLPDRIPLYWRWDGVHGSSRMIELRPGATLERYRHREQLLAVVVVRSGGGSEADRRSAWRSWARDRSWAEIADRVGLSDLERLEVTRRGASGRVVELTAVGRSGERKDLRGFPIRRALNLPENLFSFHVMTTADGEKTVRFLGRGWGHGVGLCQNGAYGLARSGMTYDAILRHYYTGIDIERWPGRSP
jgi:stage II sporulation protein D